MAKHEISLSPTAIAILNKILSEGGIAEISLVGKRLRIRRIRAKTEYDIMIGD